MQKTERLVEIGGDAAGMSAACQARRVRADLQIVAFERGAHTSYSACGMPYYVGSVVADVDPVIARDGTTLREPFDHLVIATGAMPLSRLMKNRSGGAFRRQVRPLS